jgi:hypothetical protein
LDAGNRPTGTKYDRSFDQTPPEDRPRQTPPAAPRSQPAARPPTARPPSQPASQPAVAQQPAPTTVPTTGQINHGLKTGAQVSAAAGEVITAEQFDKIKAAVISAKIKLPQFKAWLKGVYGYDGSAQILKGQYPNVLSILMTHPEVVKNYGTDPMIVQTPPLPRQPGDTDPDEPLPEEPPAEM